MILTYIVGELQGGIGTAALIERGVRADYFINSEPTDLAALTMHAAAFVFTIGLIGQTRHMPKREAAVDVIVAACYLIPRLNAITFAGARSPSMPGSTACMSVWCTVRWGVRCRNGGRRRWADYARINGSGRFVLGQTREGALADMAAELAPSWNGGSPG